MNNESTYQHSYIADSHPWTKWLLFHQKRNSCIKISIDVFLHVHVTKLNMYNSPCLIYNKKDHKGLMLFKLISVSEWKRNFFSFNQACCWLGILFLYGHRNEYRTQQYVCYKTWLSVKWEMQRTQEDEERRKTNIGYDQTPVLNFLLS